MKIIDAMGKPCPIPVVEAKKALAEHDTDHLLIKVDNLVSVQNLEKMTNSFGYDFSYSEITKNAYEVTIIKRGEIAPSPDVGSSAPRAVKTGGLTVVISRNTMGDGSEELGKILIKGFIYSLTELTVPPEFLIFLNSGAFLTSEGANTIADLQKLEECGTKILTCGTCANYYSLQDKLAVGSITDMYGITEKMANATSVINI